jgi:hypothetical protein
MTSSSGRGQSRLIRTPSPNESRTARFWRRWSSPPRARGVRSVTPPWPHRCVPLWADRVAVDDLQERDAVTVERGRHFSLETLSNSLCSSQSRRCACSSHHLVVQHLRVCRLACGVMYDCSDTLSTAQTNGLFYLIACDTCPDNDGGAPISWVQEVPAPMNRR